SPDRRQTISLSPNRHLHVEARTLARKTRSHFNTFTHFLPIYRIKWTHRMYPDSTLFGHRHAPPSNWAWLSVLALAAVLPAGAQSIRPDWRHIGNSAMELSLP